MKQIECKTCYRIIPKKVLKKEPHRCSYNNAICYLCELNKTED